MTDPKRGAILWGYVDTERDDATCFLVAICGPKLEAYDVRRELMQSCERRRWAIGNDMLLTGEEAGIVLDVLPRAAREAIHEQQTKYDRNNAANDYHARVLRALTALIEMARLNIPAKGLDHFNNEVRRIAREAF